jgi:hypothetical protein
LRVWESGTESVDIILGVSDKSFISVMAWFGCLYMLLHNEILMNFDERCKFLAKEVKNSPDLLELCTGYSTTSWCLVWRVWEEKGHLMSNFWVPWLFLKAREWLDERWPRFKLKESREKHVGLTLLAFLTILLVVIRN